MVDAVAGSSSVPPVVVSPDAGVKRRRSPPPPNDLLDVAAMACAAHEQYRLGIVGVAPCMFLENFRRNQRTGLAGSETNRLVQTAQVLEREAIQGFKSGLGDKELNKRSGKACASMLRKDVHTTKLTNPGGYLGNSS